MQNKAGTDGLWSIKAFILSGESAFNMDHLLTVERTQ